MTLSDHPAFSDPSTQAPYAEWLARALTFFLDFLPALILMAIAQMFFYSSVTLVTESWSGGPSYQVLETSGPGFGYFALYVIAILYWFWNKGFLEGTTGQSLAKRWLGFTTVSAATGAPIGVGKGIVRAFLSYLEFISILLCGIGLVLWLWPIWDPKHQSLLSDRAANAVVLHTGKPT